MVLTILGLMNAHNTKPIVPIDTSSDMTNRNSGVTAKRARPASQASGLASDRPCRLQAALFVLTNADIGGSTS